MVDSWTVIANPTSGGGRGGRVCAHLVDDLRQNGVRVSVSLTSARGDGARLARIALDQGAKRIAICGGDGTIHEVVNAVVGHEVTIGLVPCGRGNDLARALKIPGDHRGIFETLTTGVERRIDLGKVGDRYFCTVATLGLDAVVTQAVYENRVPFSGQLAYTLAVLKCLRPFECPRVSLHGDFGSFEGRILLAATGNTAFYGSGIQITPGAVADSGVFEVCLVPETSKLNVLRLFPKAFQGEHVTSPLVRIKKTRTLVIESEYPQWIFADGEPICKTPATIEIVPKVLNVQVPRTQRTF